MLKGAEQIQTLGLGQTPGGLRVKSAVACGALDALRSDRPWEAGQSHRFCEGSVGDMMIIIQGLVHVPFWGLVSHHLQTSVGLYIPNS